MTCFLYFCYLLRIFVVIRFLIDDVDCHGANPQEDRATYVSSNGTNDPTCFNAGHNNPCQSLGYVLNSVSQCDTNCTVIVLSSQSGLDVSKTLNTNQSLYIIGQGMISINFNQLIINMNGTSFLSFVNINVPQPYVKICGDGTSFITFDNTIVTSAFIKICGFRELKLTNSLFQNNIRLNFTQDTSVLIENTTFKSQKSQNLPLELIIQLELIDYISIKNSLFQNIKPLSLEIRNATKVNIEECMFYNNEAWQPMISLQANNLYIRKQISYTIINCVFKNNSVNDIHSLLEFRFGILHFVYTTYIANVPTCLTCVDTKVQCVIDITNSSILTNNGMVLNSTDIAGCWYRIINSTILGNKASTSIVQLNSNIPQSMITSGKLLVIDNSIIENNYVPFKTEDNNAVMFIQCVTRVVMINSTRFIKNTGTSLALIECNLDVHGNIAFENNVAVYGGGVYFDKFASVGGKAKIQFVNNTAQYGTAMYFGKNIDCLETNCVQSEINVTLFGNSVLRGSISYIFSFSSWCKCNQTYHSNIQNCWNISYDVKPVILSYATNITVSDTSMELFSGETIVLDINVLDCSGASSTCVAQFFGCSWDESLCNYTVILNDNINPTVPLSSGKIDTRLLIQFNNSLLGNGSLLFKCQDPPINGANATISVKLVPCPVGMVYNYSNGQCVCAVFDSDILLCSVQNGIVCIKKGYWFQQMNIDKPISCPHSSYCNFSMKACPSDLTRGLDYFHLTQNEDDQCRDGHGGTLCMNCTVNKCFTYLALQCIDKSLCKPWHPYMLLLIAIIFPVLTGIFLILVVQIQSDIGSGYLYGPLFFLAVLGQLPLGQYPTLDKIVSVFAASVLLQFKAFGFIPWCFFASMNPLYSTFLQFLNPIIMFVVLLTTVFIARRCPRKFLKLQRSPIQAMCILILVSYWSLIHTSIMILTPFNFNENTVVLLQPDLPYLHKAHIPLWIISLLIMISLGVLVFLMALSQCFNFHRMKPLLDELQSCYHDKYRWYGVVYVCTWIIIQGALYKYIVFQTVILAVTLAHCLVQPYKKKWLNMCDTCLLLDLLFLSALLSDQNQDIPQMKEKAIYLIVVIPLFFICVGATGIITVRTGLFALVKQVFKLHFSKYKMKFTVRQNSIQEPQNDYFTDEREPLIRILEEQ